MDESGCGGAGSQDEQSGRIIPCPLGFDAEVQQGMLALWHYRLPIPSIAEKFCTTPTVVRQILRRHLTDHQITSREQDEST